MSNRCAFVLIYIENGDISNAQLQLEFKVFLLNEKTQLHTQESRQLRFWFKYNIDEEEQARTAQDFFKELVAPLEFPRGKLFFVVVFVTMQGLDTRTRLRVLDNFYLFADYVGFIKKIMKMMQLKYSQIRKIEIELRQLSESEHLPDRPCKFFIFKISFNLSLVTFLMSKCNSRYLFFPFFIYLCNFITITILLNYYWFKFICSINTHKFKLKFCCFFYVNET